MAGALTASRSAAQGSWVLHDQCPLDLLPGSECSRCTRPPHVTLTLVLLGQDQLQPALVDCLTAWAPRSGGVLAFLLPVVTSVLAFHDAVSAVLQL